MKDLFEFKIVTYENLSEYVIDSFIAFIENNSVSWGGGYSEKQINGGLYVDESVNIDINHFVKEFLTFFLNLEIKIDKIEINIEDFYFNAFDYYNFMKDHASLPVHIDCWEV